jgi:carboxypeptidase Taq
VNLNLQKNLKIVRETLEASERYSHACRVLGFDQQTICPSEAALEEGETIAFLSNRAFRLLKSKRFLSAAESLYANRKSLAPLDKVLSEGLHWDYMRTKNVSPAKDKKFSLVFNEAFVHWLDAKAKAKFSLFEADLEKVRRVNLEQIALMENAKPVPYDNLLDQYERGITTKDLDRCFAACKERLVPMLKKIQKSKKKIRTDFLSRPVSDESQRKMAKYLLEVIGFDFSRGAFSTSEHPFTDGLAKDDARVTTHFYPNVFYSNMFSIIHEGGHALFEQNQPAEDFEAHITNFKTLGQHESVSRFYENRIGRSRAFIHLIFKKSKELFPAVFEGVSEREFYEAMNVVAPSLIRTEADEYTYTFHVIIRYEIEKMLVNEKIALHDLPKIWGDKYEEYLGIRPSNDAEGVLQDVHWASGFGYFPTYALGNMYGAMYYNRMQSELDVESAVLHGDFAQINDWMKRNVWKDANRLDAKSWIRKITGRNFTESDFLDYLEKKYGAIYGV